MNNPVTRLLRRNVSVGQILGYALTNFTGLLIVLTAMQFYRDVTGSGSGADSFITSDYLIISKPVEGLSLFGGGSDASFTAQEIKELEVQPWAEAVGAFTTARFNVSATVDMPGMNMSTALFLESIPDDFFDISPSGWDYRPGSGEPVPVIISKEYLALYNFGFASSRGLPQISEQLIGTIPLRISVSGAGRQMWLPARIAGFSSRLNTIAVPLSFMEWANSEFGEGPHRQPSRLIVRLDTAGNPEATAYMESHGYEIAGDRSASSKAAYFLSLVTSVVIAIGALISLLAFFILLLSIYLLLRKNQAAIHGLMGLGYKPAEVARYYVVLVTGVNLGVLVLSVIGVLLASSLWTGQLEALGLTASGTLPTLLTGTAVIAAITAGNILAIRRTVRHTFRK
ncbi:MAG: ABC transporter permease [Duncaniella sp.]|nr:ABC transporter permease [Duncaniella sp.]